MENNVFIKIYLYMYVCDMIYYYWHVSGHF